MKEIPEVGQVWASKDSRDNMGTHFRRVTLISHANGFWHATSVNSKVPGSRTVRLKTSTLVDKFVRVPQLESPPAGS